MTHGKSHGFTLIELLLVLTLIGFLAALVAPTTGSAVLGAKESVLKEDLFVLRKALDDFYTDKGHYPETLELLVGQRYLRAIPRDPITEAVDWRLVRIEGGEGIQDVRSNAPGTARDGTEYGEW